MAMSVFHSRDNQVCVCVCVGGSLHFSTRATYAVNGVFAGRQLYSSVIRYRMERRELLSDGHSKGKSKGKESFQRNNRDIMLMLNRLNRKGLVSVVIHRRRKEKYKQSS